MIRASEKELERDREVMRKFVRNNPYPDYQSICDKLILEQEKDFNQFAEYGTPNHNWMKEIYEDIFDEDIVNMNCTCIYERGDIRTLHNNHQTLLLVLRYLPEKQKSMSYDDKVLIFLYFQEIVSGRWDGIGEWKD